MARCPNAAYIPCIGAARGALFETGVKSAPLPDHCPFTLDRLLGEFDLEWPAEQGRCLPLNCGEVRRHGQFTDTDLWRRGGDSNSRYPLRYARFRGGCDRPLCHLSEPMIIPFEDPRGLTTSLT